jgi:hypothetical protein
MAGLLSAQEPDKQRENTAGGSVRVREEDEDNESNVSPEEQQSYDAFVTNGMSLMHSDEGLPKLLQSIEADGSPVEGLANTVVAIIIRLEDSAKQQGMELSGDVMMHGGTELLEQAADLAEQAGVHEFTDEEIESALWMAMDIYRQTRQQQGTLPSEEISQDMGDLVSAEQEGRLEEEVPGITEFAKNRGNQAGSGGEPMPMRRGLM